MPPDDNRRIDMYRVAESGAHLVEVDLRATRDGELVVHHDADFVANGRSFAIAAYDLADLLGLASGGLLTAAEAVAAARQAGIGIYADIKLLTLSEVGRLVELIASEGMADRIILASDSTEIVADCVDLAPDVPRSVLFRSVGEDPVSLAEQTGANFVHPCWEDDARPDRLLTEAWLARVRERGLGVICWHEERPEVIRALFSLGVDGICSDEPALLTRLASPR
jgi:glycerophosphoryl diester phosphodiesterase